VTLEKLHLAIQDYMGWENKRDYSFSVRRGFTFSSKNEERHPKLATLADLGLAKGASFKYAYNLTPRGWKHTVTLLDESYAPPTARESRLVDGARACPPEKSGGPQAYMKILEILKNPEHAKYRKTVRLVGENFDPQEMNGYLFHF
jgi:hypothetical protein